MKKKIIGLLMTTMVITSLSGCGNNTVAEPSTNDTQAQTVSSEEVEGGTSTDKTEAESEKRDDNSKELYDRFLKNEEKVSIDRFQTWYSKEYDTDFNFYEEGSSYNLEEFVNTVFRARCESADSGSIANVYYNYIDCGEDGVPELAIRIEAVVDDTMIPIESVIKAFDGKLEMTYQEMGGYRESIGIANNYGLVNDFGLYSYNTWTESTGYINKDGEYQLCYSVNVTLDGAVTLNGIIPEEVAMSDENLSDLYLRSYYFEEGAWSADETLKKTWFCGEKTEDEASNGVDFKENVRILTSLLEPAGAKVYSMSEVEAKILEQEAALGVTANMHTASEVQWKELEMLDSWKEAMISNDWDIDEEEITLPYRNELRYWASDYPTLATKGNWQEEAADQLEESISDMLTARVENADLRMSYENSTTQWYITDEDGFTRIVECTVYDGAEEMDEVMNSVGYSNYEVTFSYTSGIWKDPDETVNTPVYAELYVNDKCYTYYFSGNQCVRRYEDEKGNLNPKVNDFLNNLYKIGCYYGNVMNKNREQENQYITITSLDQIVQYEDYYLLSVESEDEDGCVNYVLNRYSEFSDSCEMSSFEGYGEGESPCEWVRNAYQNQDIYPMALLGVWDVTCKDNHIDYVNGIYWWD